MKRPLSSFAAVAVLATCAVAPCQDRLRDGTEARNPAVADPTIYLVRDPAVRSELKLSDDQRRDIDELLRRHNRLLLAIRDVGPTGADAAAQPGLAEIRARLKRLLTDPQRARLQGLMLQVQGYDAFARPDIVKQLKITSEQQASLAAIADEIRAQAERLQRSAGETPADEITQSRKELHAQRHRRALAELTPRQTNTWARLLGEPFEFTAMQPSPAWAPEFEGIDAWLNSEPLALESLRGQVVVVHFFAFGCSNCINNYPWYRQWHEQFAGRPLAVIGIHTPETQAETDNAQLRRSLEEHKLKFPVAVDKEKKMWQAWSNNMWPSVYLIDRQGRLRYWWYGELDWQGAGNQDVATRQIEQLLAESPPPEESRPAP